MDYTQTDLSKEFIEEPRPATEKQKAALARAFSDEDIRGYLIHAVQVANKNAITYLKSRQMELAHDSATRAETLSTLLNLMKLHFMHYDKIKKAEVKKAKAE